MGWGLPKEFNCLMMFWHKPYSILANNLKTMIGEEEIVFVIFSRGQVMKVCLKNKRECFVYFDMKKVWVCTFVCEVHVIKQAWSQFCFHGSDHDSLTTTKVSNYYATTPKLCLNSIVNYFPTTCTMSTFKLGEGQVGKIWMWWKEPLKEAFGKSYFFECSWGSSIPTSRHWLHVRHINFGWPWSISKWRATISNFSIRFYNGCFQWWRWYNGCSSIEGR